MCDVDGLWDVDGRYDLFRWLDVDGRYYGDGQCDLDGR